MAWSTVVSLLFLFLRSVLSNPMFTPKNFKKTNRCSDDYLVERKDFLIVEFEATGSNSTYPFNDGFYGPQFYYTSTTSRNPISPCSVFDLGIGECTNRRGQPKACSCLEVQTSLVYRFSYNLTAERELSNQTIYIVWPGPPPIASKPYKIPEVRATCPKIELLSFQSSFNDNQDFLVAGEDTTVIRFEVSGNNSVHSFDGENGPQFYYTTTDMASHLGCLGFGPGTKRTGVRDACSCEMKTSNKFWLSYTRKATLDVSRGTVYLLWPGKPDLRSENYTFPEIRDISGLRLIKNVSIGVAIVLFLATVAFLGVLNNNTYGGVEDLYHHAQGRVPSDVRNQMEAANVKESVENQQEAEDETNSLDKSQNTVSSQTDATLVWEI